MNQITRENLDIPFRNRFEKLSFIELRAIYVFINMQFAIMDKDSEEYVKLVCIQLILEEYINIINSK